MVPNNVGPLLLGDRYRLIQYSERGSLSGVRAAFDSIEKRNVHLLELPPEAEPTKSSDLRPLEAANRIDQLTDLHHPALIEVYDYFVDGGRTFLVIEPIEARSFTDLFSRERTPALSNILQWSDDLFDALIYLHSRPDPFIHNDVTPSTSWLTLKSNVKLGFPAARPSPKADLSRGADSRDLPYRSLEYLWEDLDAATKSVISRGFEDAPFDELLGSRPDERADIYSLSATLYFAMTKRAPDDAMTCTVSILDGGVDPIEAVSDVNHSISKSISDVVMRGLSIKRAERYHSAYEMRMDLESATAPYFDSLTRLPNESQFRSHLNSAIEESAHGERARFALMIIELDDLEIVFDHFGPLLGNETIFKLSEKIKHTVRVNDVVGRIDANKFALLLYESGSPSDITRIAGRIQSRIAEPLKLEDTVVEIASSAGSSLSGPTEKTVEAYLKEALSSVKLAREIGPNSSAIF
jgi:diguanylate cyclase (GGDEF)-like protein